MPLSIKSLHFHFASSSHFFINHWPDCCWNDALVLSSLFVYCMFIVIGEDNISLRIPSTTAPASCVQSLSFTTTFSISRISFLLSLYIVISPSVKYFTLLFIFLIRSRSPNPSPASINSSLYYVFYIPPIHSLLLFSVDTSQCVAI